jgi:hypothetical protein
VALWVSLAVGTLFAFGQEARGAHFLSHDVCSAFVAWFVALATYSAWIQRPTPMTVRMFANCPREPMSISTNLIAEATSSAAPILRR